MMRSATALLCTTLLGGALALTSACAPDEAVIDPKVTVLDHRPDMTVEPDRLLFPDSADNAPLALLHAGDLLVSGEGTGFVRAVVSSKREGGQIIIATRRATLSEAVAHGGATQEIDPAAGDGKADGLLPFDGLISLGNTTILGNGRVNAKVLSGYFRFKPSVTLDFDFDDWELSDFEAVAAGSLEGSLVVDVQAEGNVTVRQDKPLWHSPSKTFVQFIGFVPVVETVSLELGVGVEVATEGSSHVTVGGKLSGNLAAGARYDGRWHIVNDKMVQFIPVTKAATGGDGSATVDVYVYAELDLKFYGLAGPFIYIAPYIGMTHDSDGWAGIYGLYGAFGGQIEVFDNRVAGFESELFDWYRTF